MARNSEFDAFKHHLKQAGYTSNPPRQTHNGYQFMVFKGQASCLVKITNTDTDTQIDIDTPSSPQIGKDILDELKQFQSTQSAERQPLSSAEPLFAPAPDQDPEQLIVVNHIGYYDYFGPLVVVALAITPEAMSAYQAEAKLGKQPIPSLIKHHFQHTILTISPEDINMVSQRFSNPVHLLSWAHYRAIEDCQKLCNFNVVRFTTEDAIPLVRTTFLSKNKKPLLYANQHRPAHPAMQLASAVAEGNYHASLTQLSKHFEIDFQRGSCWDMGKTEAEFVEKHGELALVKVAKGYHKKETSPLDDLSGYTR